MKLSEQVISLELAKRLKELGIENKKSAFYYGDNEGEWVLCFSFDGEKDPIIEVIRKLEEGEDGGFYSAFTVAELLEKLPSYIILHHSLTEQEDSGNIERGYTAENINMNFGEQKYRHDKNPANVLAEWLIYLIENKLIKL